MFVMTSQENHEETVQFFKENGYFGGLESSFVFFSQLMLPAVDTKGKILMQSPYKMKLAPNGHGALFEAIRSEPDIRDSLTEFEYIQVTGVDNALNKILDPIHIGFTHTRNLDSSVKIIEKEDPREKLGIIGKKNGKYALIEYSDMPADLANEREPDGSLLFKHGSIHNFVCRSDFLLELTSG